MVKKLNKATVNERIRNRGIALTGEYVNGQTGTEFQCSKGHVWQTTPSHVLQGSGCPTCSRKKKLTKEEVNRRLASRGIRLISAYVSGKTHAKFRCSNGHEWMAMPSNILNKKGCPYCAGNQKLTAKQVNEKLAHFGIRLIGEYKGTGQLAEFECSKGHRWTAHPTNTLRSTGCPICNKRVTYTTEQFREMMVERGFELIGEYVNNRAKVHLRCPEGHTWFGKPGHVLAGIGCPHCAGWTPLTRDIINDRIRTRGITMLGKYKNAHAKAKFRCSEGHEWVTTPNLVARGSGCPTCAEPGFDPNAPALLYYVCVEGDLYKIGITNLPVEKRFEKDLPKIRIVKTWKYAYGIDAAKAEREVLNEFVDFLYDGPPVLKGKGNTEIFTADVLGLDQPSLHLDEVGS